MLVFEPLVQSNCALGAIACNSGNGWEFSMIHIVVSGCNHELVANLPVDLLNYCELVITWLDCSIKVGPRLLGLAMDVKDTVMNTNALLSENWHGWVILFTVHSDRQLTQVWVPFSANF